MYSVKTTRRSSSLNAGVASLPAGTSRRSSIRSDRPSKRASTLGVCSIVGGPSRGEAEGFEGVVDGRHLDGNRVRDIEQPGADDAGSGPRALLRFAVVRGFALDRALRRRHVGVGGGSLGLLGSGIAVSGAVPGVGEGGRAGQEALAQDLDREGPGPLAGLAGRDGAAHGLSEGVEGLGQGLLARAAVEQDGLGWFACAEPGRG